MHRRRAHLRRWASPLLLLPWLLVLTPGCLHDTRPATYRGAASIFESAQEVKAPLKDRCAMHGKSSVRQPCEDAKFLAQTWVRKLGTTDSVCLEGGLGEVPGAACQARAEVTDASSGRVLLHLRDAQPSSHFFNQVGTDIWFEEGALVDLYLSEQGY